MRGGRGEEKISLCLCASVVRFPFAPPTKNPPRKSPARAALAIHASLEILTRFPSPVNGGWSRVVSR